MQSSYAEFLTTKQRVWTGKGREPESLPAQLFDWQVAITKWAVRKGCAAVFADCGLGKTFMQVAWAQALNVPTLILAPLCVAEQTVLEAAKLGIAIGYAKDQSQVRTPITITNYERLDGFDQDEFSAVVLDESSILKSFNGKTRTKLIQTFARTPFRLCCTATPSPNDIAELANHAEFLGLMTRAEFLATWFVHDDQGWRMKKHAVQPFYRWLASWAIAFRRPSDLGYSDDGFRLRKLVIHEHIVEGGGQYSALFPELGLKGITGRMEARRDSLEPRVAKVRQLALTGRTGPDSESCQWIAWCGLNPEADALARLIPDAVNVSGSDSHAEKVGALSSFVAGETRMLVTKLRIAGYGMNFQNCHHMAFVGIGDSFEQYYQGIRRCWRFGQKHNVHAHIVVGDAERAVVANVRQKEARHDELSAALLAHMRDFEREELIAC